VESFDQRETDDATIEVQQGADNCDGARVAGRGSNGECQSQAPPHQRRERYKQKAIKSTPATESLYDLDFAVALGTASGFVIVFL
jgi:hypothetical protein